MPDSDIQTRRDDSRRWSEDLLGEAGFARQRNTSVFSNAGARCALSPGVGPGQNGRYWFDLRDANLKSLPVGSTIVVLRLVGHGFVVAPLREFAPHLNDRTRRLTSAGPAYGFICEFGDGLVMLRSSSDSGYSFALPLLNRAQALDSLLES